MDRITKHDLERRVERLNRYLDDDAYDLSWANGGVRIYDAAEGEGRRGTKREIYDVLGGMCHVAALTARSRHGNCR
jgi:hypothetical protein